MDDLAPQGLDHADASILASWNEIRPETQEPELIEAPAAEPEKPAAEKLEKPRDTTGKFAKAETQQKAAVDEAALASAPQQQNDQPVEQKAAIESPKSLRKEVADKHWGKLDPEIQSAWNQRDANYQQGIERYRARAENFDKVEAAFAPYKATLDQLGAAPEQAVAQLLSIDHILRTGQPQEKAALIAQISRQFGVPLEDVSQVGPLQQQLLAQRQELLSFQSQQTQTQQQQAQRELDALTGEVVKFSEGKEHFATVQGEMYSLLPSIAAQNPNASPVEKLQKAYDIAIYANPTVRAAIEVKQQQTAKAEALQKASEAKKAASINRTPRGVVAPTAAVGSMDDTIRAKAKELGFA